MSDVFERSRALQSGLNLYHVKNDKGERLAGPEINDLSILPFADFFDFFVGVDSVFSFLSSLTLAVMLT